MTSFTKNIVCFCLVVVCCTRLGLALPVEDPRQDEETQGPLDDIMDDDIKTSKESDASGEKVSPENLTVANNSTTAAAHNTTITNFVPSTTNTTNVASNKNVSTTVSIPPTVITFAETTEAEINEEPEIGPSMDNETIVKNNDVIEAPKEFRFWWSDSTLLSILIPVSVGLGSGLFIITWLCCMRWFCCRRRCCLGRGRVRTRVDPSTNKKTLRVKEDFRQLRQVDRVKLLAETSDDEF